MRPVAKQRRQQRPGTAMIAVLVIVVLISFACLRFATRASRETRAVSAQFDREQLQLAIDSGLLYLSRIVEQPGSVRMEMGSLDDNAALFRGIVIDGGEQSPRYVCVTFLSRPVDQSDRSVAIDAAPIAYGLADESRLLDLRTVLQWEQAMPGDGVRALAQLTGNNEQLVAVMLDWMDEDDDRREQGAELADYAAAATDGGVAAPRNQPPACLEELLLVPGMRRATLFGPDKNANFHVSQDERNAFTTSMQSEPANSVMSPTFTRSDDAATRLHTDARSMSLDMSESPQPLAELLTVHASKRNESFDGRSRINLNDEDSARLKKQLSERFPEDWVEFILAYRQNPPAPSVKPASEESADGDDDHASRRSSGPLIASVYDLIGVTVTVESDDGSVRTVRSPFGTSPNSMREYLLELADNVTTVADPVLRGRINVNTAPLPVLSAIPGMTQDLLDKIDRARMARQSTAARHHGCWLLLENTVTLEEMKMLAPHITAGADVFRTQICAFFQPVGQPAADAMVIREEVVIDGTYTPPRIVYRKDLTPLGRGFAAGVLAPPLADAAAGQTTGRSVPASFPSTSSATPRGRLSQY